MNLKLLANEGDLFKDPTLYRRLIGKLNFLTHTKLDLSYTIQTLSQFMQSPRIPHWKALQHTLNYIYSTCGQVSFYKGKAGMFYRPSLILTGLHALILRDLLLAMFLC